MSWRLFTLGALLAAGALRGDEAVKPRLDPQGDPLPAGAVMRLGSVRLRPDQPSVAAAFAPDGKTLYSLAPDGVLHAWDPATGKLLRRLRFPGNGTRCLAVSGDGKTLIVGCLDGAIRFADAVTGAEQRALVLGGGIITSLSLSADGKTLVAQLATGMVSVWDAEAGKQRYSTQGAPPGTTLAAVLPDGKHVVLGRQDNTLHLVDAATGKDVRDFETGVPGAARPGIPQRLQRLAVAPDGKHVAFGGTDRTVIVCSVETGKIVGRLDNQNTFPQSLAFAPGGRFLAVGGFQGVKVFGILSGKELRQLDMGPPSPCNFLAYAPDGKTLAGVAHDGRLRLWDVVAGREVFPPVGHSGYVQALAFLGDGKQLVSCGSDMRLIAWDVATGREVDSYRGLPFATDTMTRSTDGKGVAGLSGNTLTTWRPGAGPEARRLDLPPLVSMRTAISPGARWAALVSNTDRKLRLYDLEGKGREGRALTTAVNVWVHLLAFSPDGRRLAAATSDGVFRVWDCATGKEVRTLGGGDEGPPGGFNTWIRFSPDGRSILMADSANGLNVWEVAGGRQRLQLPASMVGLSSAAWSPDGRLVARGNVDGSVQLFAAPTGKELARWEGKQGSVSTLAFSPDGRLLASGGTNGTVLVWEVPAVAASPATLSDDRRAALWTDLVDADAVRAYRAVAALGDAPEPAVALIRERLKPRPAPPDAKRLEQLVVQLDSDSFAERERASQQLAEAGAAAEEVLRKALDRDVSTEVRARVRELLERIGKNGVAPERLRALRAAEVLERVGTPAARQLLEDLAKQVNDPLLEQDIQATLERLGERR